MLFETTPDQMGVWVSVDRTQPKETVWFIEKPGFFDMVVRPGDRAGPQAKLDLPVDIELEIHRDWLAVKRRTPWTLNGSTHAPDTVLGMSLSAFLAGDRNFAVLFEPGERRALESFFWSDGRLVLSILDELEPVFEVLTPSAAGWTRAELTGLPKTGVANVWRLDDEEAESNGDLCAAVQNPITPASLMMIEPGKSWEVLKRAPQVFSADGLVVSRHEAVSVDGERIPYVLVGPAETTGDAPVHLTGYGGFASPSLPYYSSAIGKLWLERGGTSVIANIRGGGEFGTRWHEAGRRAGKRLSHDDFAAVAADLVARGVTAPGPASPPRAARTAAS